MLSSMCFPCATDAWFWNGHYRREETSKVLLSFVTKKKEKKSIAFLCPYSNRQPSRTVTTCNNNGVVFYCILQIQIKLQLILSSDIMRRENDISLYENGSSRNWSNKWYVVEKLIGNTDIDCVVTCSCELWADGAIYFVRLVCTS